MQLQTYGLHDMVHNIPMRIIYYIYIIYIIYQNIMCEYVYIYKYIIYLFNINTYIQSLQYAKKKHWTY